MNRRKLKWLRSLNRYSDVCYTSGVYEIERIEFSLPTRSVEYRITKDGLKIKREFFYLVDAKDWAEEDNAAGCEVCSGPQPRRNH